jgi:hypothetical protein
VFVVHEEDTATAPPSMKEEDATNLMMDKWVMRRFEKREQPEEIFRLIRSVCSGGGGCCCGVLPFFLSFMRFFGLVLMMWFQRQVAAPRVLKIEDRGGKVRRQGPAFVRAHRPAEGPHGGKIWHLRGVLHRVRKSRSLNIHLSAVCLFSIFLFFRNHLLFVC